MKIQLATLEQVDEIMEIIEDAKIRLKELTKCQWQFGYPNNESFINDINNGFCYVGMIEEKIAIVASYIPGVEKTYLKIYNGKWLNDKEYITIHRIAINKDYAKMGLAKEMLKFGEEIAKKNHAKSIRVDTHYTNIPMNKTLLSNGFTLVGEIYLSDIHDYNNIRNAYEKLL